MRHAEVIQKQEPTALHATKYVAKVLTAIIMLIATVAVFYFAS